MDTSFPFADWFRSSSTYIDAHRGRTFVVLIEGEGLEAERRAPLIQDLALLHTLGVRLVLVFGARTQVRRALAQARVEPRRHQGRFVVDEQAMTIIEREISALRLAIEARLSPGLSNTPLHGVEINAISGNLVMARPLGIREGVDFLRGGEVRRVRTAAIRNLLDQRSLVVLPPLGYSSTGEVFDIDAADIARHAAVSLVADKLIILGHARGLYDAQGGLLRQLSPGEAQGLVCDDDGELAEHVHIACTAARQGVARTHLLSWRDRDALLAELFTRDGVGTMITRERYEQLRTARIDDIGGLQELLRPLEERGMLVARSRERLEQEIDDYVVIERDGMVIGCAALYAYPEAACGELACVAVHGSYRGSDRGSTLLAEVEKRARAAGLEQLFALTTHTLHWFLEHDFTLADLEALPRRRRECYNLQRNSRVLIKALAAA
ncbi:amino-acid N-acetyltransferase [Kushneria aurantia]|uniref:Amino-acid acetyltransferase n=1 Tax=Kushneria aurantia TaxID=504092 RepID=A0ABV6G361_9GAMM|nr:amino-acid N-acetyltransferase [Kushneria aurantia]